MPVNVAPAWSLPSRRRFFWFAGTRTGICELSRIYYSAVIPNRFDFPSLTSIPFSGSGCSTTWSGDRGSQTVCSAPAFSERAQGPSPPSNCRFAAPSRQMSRHVRLLPQTQEWTRRQGDEQFDKGHQQRRSARADIQRILGKFEIAEAGKVSLG